MLQEIFIKDFILIESLTTSFQDGFVAITGETGAGKSVFVEAMELLRGKRTDASVVRQGASKAIVEGVFTHLSPRCIQRLVQEELLEDPAQPECIIRREVASAGRSRAFINDTPVTLSLLSEITETLLDIHSQHANLLVKDSRFQTDFLDAHLPENTTLKAYKETYARLKTEQEALKQLLETQKREQEAYEINLFKLREIDALDLSGEDPDTLENRERELRFSQEIKDALDLSILRLSEQDGTSAVATLKQVERVLESAAPYKQNIADYAHRIDSVIIELEDIASDLDSMRQSVEAAPEEMERIASLLNALNALYYKFTVTSWSELRGVREELAHRVEQVSGFEEQIAQKREQIARLQGELTRLGHELLHLRREAAQGIEQIITESLRRLEMPHARFCISIAAVEEFLPTGMNRIAFLFSANPDIAPAPVGEIASGGEISRLMLALKAQLHHAHFAPSIVFDEVDTGISGVTARRVGEILGQMAANRQLFVITHLPQIAACATQHFLIYKEQGASGTHTYLKALTQEERVREIARLQSGDNLSAAALAAANELLNPMG